MHTADRQFTKYLQAVISVSEIENGKWKTDYLFKVFQAWWEFSFFCECIHGDVIDRMHYISSFRVRLYIPQVYEAGRTHW